MIFYAVLLVCCHLFLSCLVVDPNQTLTDVQNIVLNGSTAVEVGWNTLADVGNTDSVVSKQLCCWGWCSWVLGGYRLLPNVQPPTWMQPHYCLQWGRWQLSQEFDTHVTWGTGISVETEKAEGRACIPGGLQCCWFSRASPAACLWCTDRLKLTEWDGWVWCGGFHKQVHKQGRCMCRWCSPILTASTTDLLALVQKLQGVCDIFPVS